MQYAINQFLARVATVLQPQQIITDKLLCLAYGTDASFYRLIPKVVLHINNEVEVLQVITFSNQLKIPLTFRAAGTSLNGQGITEHVLVVITNAWNNSFILENGNYIRLQPGITGGKANWLLKPYNRKIGPDPSSIATAKIGGIVANNASGMCCGVKYNSYHTLHSIRIIFHDGSILDTADKHSVQAFKASHAHVLNKITVLATRVKADPDMVAFIRKKYQIKNTMGYSINALIDFSDEIDILAHLMVGSEGTLGFISEFGYKTIVDLAFKATTFIFFQDIYNCAQAITALSTKVVAAEILSRATLAVVADMALMPEQYKEQIRGLDEDAAGLLLKVEAESHANLTAQIAAIHAIINQYAVLYPVEFIEEAAKQEVLWQARRELLPCMGAHKPALATLIMEDVAFPIENLADGIQDLEAMLKEFGYLPGIAGHALTGNVHFNLIADLQDDQQLERYTAFMHCFTEMVVKKYNGSLKAEHGTGRNMAPFVAKEWGEQLYQLMQEIKQLLDPANLMNPGVVINDDELIFVKNIKKKVQLNNDADKCIECGFCEAVCPSRNLSLTPRQRLSSYKEMLSLKDDNPAEFTELQKKYQYYAVDTCAATGLCALECPVGINTGELMKELRAQRQSFNPIAQLMASNFKKFIVLTRLILKVSSVVSAILGPQVMYKLAWLIHKLTNRKIPLWNPAMPHAAIPVHKIQWATKAPTKPKVVYWPTCTTQIFGPATGSDARDTKLAAISLLHKSNFVVIIPDTVTALCCGQPLDSEGNFAQANLKRDEVLAALKHASNNFTYPIVTDASPCALRINNNSNQVKIYDSVEFIYKYCLPQLKITKMPGKLAVHQTCSTRRANNGQYLLAIARTLADEIVIPESVSCCGFAGDKGFSLPELNAAALKDLKTEVSGCSCGISTSRTCEIGLAHYSGLTYYSVFDLLDRQSIHLVTN